MKRDYKLYLNDIKESIIQIDQYIKGVSEENFKKDKKLQDAAMRRLEIIGEASRNIPRALKEKNKDVPWFEMAQFRDLISHSYFKISLNHVWRTIKERVPSLKEKMKDIELV